MTRARDLAAFVSNADGDIKFDTDTLFVDSSANKVGIRKTDPDVPLHIDMGTDNNAFYIESSDQFANIGLVDGSGSGKIVMDGGELAFTTGGDATTSFTNSSERMRIDSSGKVGIGTVSPSQKLHVEGAGNQFILLNNSSTNDGFYFKAGTGASSIQTNGGSNIINFFTSGTERMRLLSGGGLTFNGDTAAANALDDYEEGTFTPSIGSGAGSGGAATSATGSYTKIGNTVFASCHMSINTLGSMSGTFFVTGFPFAAAAGYTLSQGAVRSQGISGANHQPVTFEMVAGSANGRFHFSSGTNAQLLVAVTQFTAGDFFAFGITYNV